MIQPGRQCSLWSSDGVLGNRPVPPPALPISPVNAPIDSISGPAHARANSRGMAGAEGCWRFASADFPPAPGRLEGAVPAAFDDHPTPALHSFNDFEIGRASGRERALI